MVRYSVLEREFGGLAQMFFVLVARMAKMSGGRAEVRSPPVLWVARFVIQVILDA